MVGIQLDLFDRLDGRRKFAKFDSIPTPPSPRRWHVSSHELSLQSTLRQPVPYSYAPHRCFGRKKTSRPRLHCSTTFCLSVWPFIPNSSFSVCDSCIWPVDPMHAKAPQCRLIRMLLTPPVLCRSTIDHCASSSSHHRLRVCVFNVPLSLCTNVLYSLRPVITLSVSPAHQPAENCDREFSFAPTPLCPCLVIPRCVRRATRWRSGCQERQ